MDTVWPFILEHAQFAHWFVFGLLMLAGLNFPISEDLVVIASGVLASTLVPENTWKIFLGLFLGAYLSDWMVYWMGRLLGPKLWQIPWFARVFRPQRLKQIGEYYHRYGFLTLLVGRFIPFGVRNCLFATAGLGRMNFLKFLIADGVACLLSTSTIFTLAYFCGKNTSYLMKFFNIGIFLAFLIAVLIYLWYRKSRRISAFKQDSD